MYIQTEPTPNPSSLKFLPGETVMKQGTVDYRNQTEAKNAPMALDLFKIKGIEGVFFGSDFISITKNNDLDWEMIKNPIIEIITNYFEAGKKIINSEVEVKDKNISSNSEESEAVNKIREILDTKVRPAVAKDGGDIVFKSFEKGIVYLNMQGSCAGCPSSTATLKSGVENLLKHYVPEVLEVQQVT
jgi:Fe-S cluster biogenesis protein NfuA